MKIKENLRPFKRKFLKIKSSFIWFFYFFIHSPRFELYVKKLNKKNSIYFTSVKHDLLNNTDKHLQSYYHKEIPHRIWIYWSQGENNTPLIVQKCINTWKQLNPDWEVTVLNKQNIEKYIVLPDLPECLPIRYQANLLRTMLLNKYGGVWADATTYCHRPLTEWLPLLSYNGLFMFSNPAEDRDIENWFIASTKNNELINSWQKNLESYYLKMKRIHPAYFLAFYLYQWTIKNDNNLRTLNRRISTLNAAPCFLMKSYLLDNTSLVEVQKHINNGLPLSKLDWRLEVSEERLQELFSLL